MAQLLVANGLLSAGPDGSQSGTWAPVTELQGKLVESLLKQITKPDLASFRPGAAILLGVVCRYVPTRSFLSSYSDWAAALQESLRRDTGVAPRAAGLHALGQIFIRVRELVDVPGVRRDASSLAGKTLQLATPLLTDGGCQAAALTAVHAVLQALPSVARNHIAPLEQQLAALVAAQDTPLACRSAAAAAITLLPRASASDAAAWSMLCRRTLVSLHAAIDLLFYHGAGAGAGEGGAAADGGLGARAREQLAVAPVAGAAAAAGATDAEGLLGPAGFVGGAAGGAARPGVAHTLQVTDALLDCLTGLLTHGSSSPVPVPSHAVIMLVMRLLRVDAAALLAPGRVAPSSSGQAEVLAALPGLHSAAWRLLALLCGAVKSALMPLLALVGRLVADHLRRIKAGGAGGLACTMAAAVRTTLYDATVVVLRTGGYAAGRALATEAVGMLITELYGLSAVQQQQQQQQAALRTGAAGLLGRAAGGRPATPLGAAPPAKKAKTAGSGGSADPLSQVDVNTAAAVAAMVAPVASPADVAAQRAALAVAEALLQVYGPALTSDLRSQLDALSYHMAAVLAEADSRLVHDASTAAAARAADVAVLRVAATRALVASLAAPWPTQPPFLAEGLALLQEGLAGGGGGSVALAEVCSEGLLALEALLRPRGPPLASAVGSGAGGGSGGEPAAGAQQGLSYPRPRLWSVMDPVQPQLPPQTAPVAKPEALSSLQTAAAAGAGDGAGAGVASQEANAGAAAAGARRAAPMAVQAAAKGGAAAAATKDPGSGSGGAATAAAPPPAEAKGSIAQQRMSAKKQKAENNAAAATAEGCSGGIVPASGDVVGVATAKQSAAPEGTAAPALAPAAPKAAPAPVAAAAAAAFADASEDSEGSLPDIDSGGDSGSEEDA